jgi:hypothetical protein
MFHRYYAVSIRKMSVKNLHSKCMALNFIVGVRSFCNFENIFREKLFRFDFELYVKWNSHRHSLLSFQTQFSSHGFVEASEYMCIFGK